MAGCCPTPLCPQFASLPRGGVVTPNDLAVFFDPTKPCNDALTIKKIPDENEVLKGVGAPTAPPTDPTENKTWFDTATSQITHYWNAVTATWVPIVGSFPLIKKCDGTNATVSDRFLLANSHSATAVATIGGVSGASRALLTSSLDGTGCPQALKAPAAPCTDATIPVGNVFLGNLADGSIGWVRPANTNRPTFRTIAGSTTLDPAVESGIYISAAGTVTLTTPTATALCANTLVYVKRTTNNPLVVVRVTAAAGIDGAPGNTIQLGTSSKFGTLTGEGAWFQFDGTTWRIVAAY
jgi:hypothetical protein